MQKIVWRLMWGVFAVAFCVALGRAFVAPRVVPASNEKFVHQNLPALLEGRFEVRRMPSRSIAEDFPEFREAAQSQTGLAMESLHTWTRRSSYEEYATSLQNETGWTLELLRVRETKGLFAVGKRGGTMDFWMIIDKDVSPATLGALFPVIVGETGPAGYLNAWRREQQKRVSDVLQKTAYLFLTGGVLLAVLGAVLKRLEDERLRRRVKVVVEEVSRAKQKRQEARRSAGPAETNTRPTPIAPPSVLPPRETKPLPLQTKRAPERAVPNLPRKWQSPAVQEPEKDAAVKKDAEDPLVKAQKDLMLLLASLHSQNVRMPCEADKVFDVLMRGFVLPTQARSFMGGHGVGHTFLMKSVKVPSRDMEAALKWLVGIGVVKEVAGGRSYAFNSHYRDLDSPGREIGEATLRVASAKPIH